MTAAAFYTYLTRARRDLWAFLGTMPGEALLAPVLNGGRFRSINDLVIHVPIVEDSWLHEDILADAPVWTSLAGFPEVIEGPYYDHLTLGFVLDYWRAVEASTLAFLESLDPAGLARGVRVPGPGGERTVSVENILWHVMQHEVRHTAQVAVLARGLGHAPPQLDLIRYV